MRSNVGLCVAVFWALGMSGAWAGTLTARQAMNLANQRVTDAAQNNLIWMEGTHSDENLRPRIWEVTFYDPARLNAGTMVRIQDDQVLKVGGAVRLFDDARWTRFGRNFTGYHVNEIINLKRWNLDSDAVVAKALAHPRLSGYEVVGVRLLLRKPSDGDVAPNWRVTIRARPRDRDSGARWLGSLTYNAETGELLRDDLAVR
ncbi:MAG: hypothetical protein NZ483_11260 [Verrucomicrobiae bacterium]|nr:hypothetical protein [Verrucomicrobiae bacterium]MDW8343830.1 hypothetical protein [Verrucomicrobiae bacterium]